MRPNDENPYWILFKDLVRLETTLRERGVPDRFWEQEVVRLLSQIKNHYPAREIGKSMLELEEMCQELFDARPRGKEP